MKRCHAGVERGTMSLCRPMGPRALPSESSEPSERAKGTLPVQRGPAWQKDEAMNQSIVRAAWRACAGKLGSGRGSDGRMVRGAALLAAVLGLAAPVAPWAGPAVASAQTPSTRSVSPIADGVLIRCGSGVSWYPVAKVNRGTILRASGETDGWLSVDYLPGMHVVIKADEGERRGDKVALTRRSRLRALSMETPTLEESFRFVCDEFLLPGTELKYVGDIKDNAGQPAGFIVEAPACARGFVLARDVMDAAAPALAPAPAPVAAPAQAPTGTPGTTPAPTGTQAAPVQTAPAQPVPAPAVTQPSPAPSTGAPSGGTAPADSSIAVPGNAPAVQQPAATDSAGTTAPADPASTTTETADPALTSAPVLQPVAPAAPKGPTLRQLDRMYEDMLSKPVDATDPQELIEAYQTLAVELEATPGNNRTLRYIDTRLQLLRLRSQARSLLPEIQALEDASKNAADNYQVTIDRLIQNRQYLVAGRLVTSTVYDGTKLPQMYRLVSIDPSISRTVAYIVPSPELELEQKVGAIVGVLGDGKIEPSALVQIIRPTVVEILRAGEQLPAGSNP